MSLGSALFLKIFMMGVVRTFNNLQKDPYNEQLVKEHEESLIMLDTYIKTHYSDSTEYRRLLKICTGD